MTNNTITVPAGVIPQRQVKPLTPEQLQRVIAMRKARKAEKDAASADALQALADKFAPVYKVRDVTPASVKPNNNGYGKELSDDVDWNKQQKLAKGKTRLSAKDARKASKK